jgi:hypothetical protein
MRPLTILLMTFLVFVVPFSVRAQDTTEPPIGSIVELEGDGNLIMRAAEQGKSYPAHLNDQVSRNDVIQTGTTSGSRALIVMIDESRFTLGENASFKVDEYAYNDTDTTTNMARYSVTQGAFLYTSGLMTKKENPDVKITTNYGSIGIRGTSVWGGNLGEQYGVYVGEGLVSLETNRGHVFINPGQGTSVTGVNAIPERPKALPPEIITAAKSTVALKNLDQIKTRLSAVHETHPAMIAKHEEFIHQQRLQQLDNPGSVRRQGRGLLKIEQDRQDERIKLRKSEENVTPPTDEHKAEALKKEEPAVVAPVKPQAEERAEPAPAEKKHADPL